MYIIVGLGNPGTKYEKTRHNIGFRILDALAERNGIDFAEGKHKGLIGKGIVGGCKCILVKPQTFMNLSGECVRPVMDYYKEDSNNVIVVYDDITLDVGKIRIRKKGSAGGHNGIKSLIAHMGTQEFPRLRFGVGDKPAKMDLADYVTGRFSEEDEKLACDNMQRACEAVECMIEEGFDSAMNKFNG